MTTDNPYAPPAADLFDTKETVDVSGEQLIPDGRSCDMGDGSKWLGDGWRLFKAQPLMWWLTILVGGGLFMVVELIPLVNLLAVVFMPILVAGYGACARSILQEGRFEFGQLFDGFRVRPGALMLQGLIYFAGFAILTVVLLVIFGATGALGAMFGIGDPAANTTAILGLGLSFALVYAACILVLISTIIYSPYLIHEHGVPAPQAMMMSFKACLKNIPAHFLFGIVVTILAILATIPLALGWFILFPVLYLAIYASYRDIFIKATDEA